MSRYFKFAVTALCGILLGIPAAQAEEEYFYTTNLYVELDTSETGHFRAHPRSLTLQAGEYYRLELMNYSREQRHVLVAPEFEGAIAYTAGIRKLPQRVKIKEASLGRGIDLPPGARVEIYFLPTKVGRYKLFCEDRTHTAAGMDVTVDVRL